MGAITSASNWHIIPNCWGRRVTTRLVATIDWIGTNIKINITNGLKGAPLELKNMQPLGIAIIGFFQILDILPPGKLVKYL